MLTADESERLARVGPGTPAGNLLRRYWYPVGGVDEMSTRWTKRVRLLGEDLVLFRDRSGRFGLIAEACPHRRASLAYGIPQADGIRCPYHGWKFDGTGRCLDQPNEPEGSSFKDKISTAGYPVQELGGLLWAYLGPQPSPLLPRLDGFVVPGTIRMCGAAVLPCNWLQIMENSHDPVHTEWLHGHLQEFVEEQRGAKVKYAISRHHVKIGFDEFEYGIYKRRLMEGQPEDADDWRVGHPVFFPNTLAVGSAGGFFRMHAFQIRVPIDDEHTWHLWYQAYVVPPGTSVPEKMLREVPIYDVPFRDAQGEYLLDLLDAQDVMAWISQGPIAKRDLEHLGSTDRGVTMFRRMLQREIEKVEAGGDPIGVLRDPAKNELIELPVEHGKDMLSDGFASRMKRVQARYYPYADELTAIFSAANPVKPSHLSTV
jgi:5,5'-dehydrodivanillate O-demethylase oxygenase subunit